jgi:hypothetical protein
VGWSSALRPSYTGHSLPVFVFQPDHRITDVPVVFCLGFGAGALTPSTPTQLELLGTVLTGVVVLCPSLTTDNTDFGNAASLTAITDLLGWSAAQYGTRTDKVGYMGGSMGAFRALNHIRYNPSILAACALAIPALDLQGIHDRNPLGVAATLEAAYGGHAGYLAALDTHDPGRHPELYIPVADRITLWYGADDLVTTAAEVEAFATGSGVDARNQGNIGHTGPGDPNLGDAMYFQEIVDWFAPLIWRA